MNRAEAIEFAKEQQEIFGGRMGEFLKFVEDELTQTNTSNTLNALDCVDTISRAKAIRWIKTECNPYGKPTLDYDTSCRIMEHLEQMPSATVDLEELSQALTDEVIAAHERIGYEKGIADGYAEAITAEPRWIPFKTRPLTEEEREDHPEWDCILDCKLPDNGQRILVSINLRGHEEVQQDEYYSDDGSYLDSDYEIGTEATAWMPLPQPWKGADK